MHTQMAADQQQAEQGAVSGTAAAMALDVVLVHGAGADHSHFPRELAELPVRGVHFLDLPGHGGEAALDDGVSIERYADALNARVTALGLSNVLLVGHSMGGAVVQTLALRHPAWLKGLVLLGTGSRLKVLPALIEQLEHDFPAAVEFIVEALFGPATDEALMAAEQARYLATDWRVIRDDFLACNQFDVGTRLGEIGCPTLVLCGTEDVLTPPKYAQSLASGIAGARLVLVEGGGHMVALEQPRAVFAALADFIDSLGG